MFWLNFKKYIAFKNTLQLENLSKKYVLRNVHDILCVFHFVIPYLIVSSEESVAEHKNMYLKDFDCIIRISHMK